IHFFAFALTFCLFLPLFLLTRSLIRVFRANPRRFLFLTLLLLLSVFDLSLIRGCFYSLDRGRQRVVVRADQGSQIWPDLAWRTKSSRFGGVVLVILRPIRRFRVILQIFVEAD